MHQFNIYIIFKHNLSLHYAFIPPSSSFCIPCAKNSLGWPRNHTDLHSCFHFFITFKVSYN